MKRLDKILIALSVFFSCYVNAEKSYDDVAGYHQLPEIVQAAFREFDDKAGFCLASTRDGNPYPISEWLIELPQDKQGSVLMYLSRLALFNCSTEARMKLESIVKKQGEMMFFAMMQDKGWLSQPVYGEFADSGDNVQLEKDDEAALRTLIERNYLPFDVIQTKLALDLLKEQRSN